MAKSKKETKQLTIAQQKKLASEEVAKFIQSAKQSGEELTVDEINDNLSPEIVAAEVLDAFMQSLEAHGVVVTEHKIEKDGAAFLEDPEEE